MEVRVYGRDMRLAGIIDDATSVRWRRRYYQPGEFEIHMPATAANIRITPRQSYVWIRGKAECGIIEYRTIEEGRKKSEVTIKGRFASSIYDRRLIKETTFFNGKAEEIMHQIAKSVAPFPGVIFGGLNGYPEKASFQATYKNALAYLTKLSKSANIGYRLRPDFAARTLTFETYRGTDHSYRQSRNPRVLFSDDMEALSKATLSESDALLKNVVYVGGRGEGADRTIVVCGDDSLSGFDRREDFLSATDIENGEGMTESDYRSALARRGDDALGQRIASEALEGGVPPDGNFKYMADYDLGDVVTVRKESFGVARDFRITEAEEAYSRGAMVVTPTFGDTIPDAIDWSDK